MSEEENGKKIGRDLVISVGRRLRQTIVVAVGWWLFCGAAHAASFDCTKAQSKVEHHICDNADLSKVDEELAAHYKAAVQDTVRAESVRQTQKQWLKQRNDCVNADCVRLAYINRISALRMLKTGGAFHVQPAPTTRRITFGPKEASPICEAYATLLNQTPTGQSLAVCGNRMDQLPGAIPLSWEILDPLQNQELLYKLEWLLRGRIVPAPEVEWDAWLRQFKSRAQSRATLPIVKQALVRVESAQVPQLIYSYEAANMTCSRTKQAAGKHDGIGPFILFHNELAQTHEWIVSIGYPFTYEGRLHLLYSYLNEKTHYMEWSALIQTYEIEVSSPLQSGTGYKTVHVCDFHDSEIFYPPTKR